MANPFTNLFNQLFGQGQQQAPSNQESQPNPVQQLLQENLIGPLGINAFLEEYAQSLGQARATERPRPTLGAPVSSEQLTAETDPFQRSQLRAQNRGAFAEQARAQVAYELAPHVQALIESGGAYWEQMPPDVQNTIARGVYALMGGPATDLGVEISEDFVTQNLDDPTILAALQAIASGGQDYFQRLNSDTAPEMRSFTEIEGLPQGAAIASDLATGLLGGFGELAVGTEALSRVPGAIAGTRNTLANVALDRLAVSTRRAAMEVLADNPAFAKLPPNEQENAINLFMFSSPNSGDMFGSLVERNGLTPEDAGQLHLALSRNVPSLPDYLPETLRDGGNRLFDGMDDDEANETFNRMADQGGELESGEAVQFAGEGDALEELRARQAASGERILRDAQGLTPPEYADALVGGQADPGTALVSFAGALLDMAEEGVLDPALASEMGGAIEVLANGDQVDTREILGLIRDGLHPDLADEVVRRATTRHNDLQWELANRPPPELGTQGPIRGDAPDTLADGQTTVDDILNDPRLDYEIWASRQMSRFLDRHRRIIQEEGPEALYDELTLGPAQASPEFARRYVSEWQKHLNPSAGSELARIIGEDGTVINLLTPDDSGMIDPGPAIEALVHKNQMDRADAMSLVFRYLNETYNAGGPMDELTMLGAAGLDQNVPKPPGPVDEGDMLREAGLSRMGEGELSGINEADVEPGDLDELMIQARMWHERSGTEEPFGEFLDRMAGEEVTFGDMLEEAGLSREEGVAGEAVGPARPEDQPEEMPEMLRMLADDQELEGVEFPISMAEFQLLPPAEREAVINEMMRENPPMGRAYQRTHDDTLLLEQANADPEFEAFRNMDVAERAEYYEGNEEKVVEFLDRMYRESDPAPDTIGGADAPTFLRVQFAQYFNSLGSNDVLRRAMPGLDAIRDAQWEGRGLTQGEIINGFIDGGLTPEEAQDAAEAVNLSAFFGDSNDRPPGFFPPNP